MNNTFLFTVYNKTFTIELPMTHDGEIALRFYKPGDVNTLAFIANSDLVYNITTEELLKCRCQKHMFHSALPYLLYTAKKVTLENLNPIFNKGRWENE